MIFKMTSQCKLDDSSLNTLNIIILCKLFWILFETASSEDKPMIARQVSSKGKQINMKKMQCSLLHLTYLLSINSTIIGY